MGMVMMIICIVLFAVSRQWRWIWQTLRTWKTVLIKPYHLSTPQRKTVPLPPYYPERTTLILPHRFNHHPPTPPTPVHHPLLQMRHQHPPYHPLYTHWTPRTPLRVLLQSHTFHDGIDTTQLEIIIAGDGEMLSHVVGVILPVREEGGILVRTSLLRNVAVNTLLVIMMLDILNGTIGFLTSTGLPVLLQIVIFESARTHTLSTTPHGLFVWHLLQVGEKAVSMVKVIILIFCIIAKPLVGVLPRQAVWARVGDYVF